MKLLIDAGNTRAKWALMQDPQQLLAQGVCDYDSLATGALPEAMTAVLAQVQSVWLANVAGADMAQQWSQRLGQYGLVVNQLKVQASASLHNDYVQAQQLGIDRWCAALAAHQHMQAAGFASGLIINAGSALTVDAIHQGHYLGGIICPGLTLQQHALQQLAFARQANPAMPVPGRLQDFPDNSQDACYSGILRACLGAIHYQYSRLQQRAQQAIWCGLTGGDAAQFDPHLRQSGYTPHHDATLVLQGIYQLACESESVTK